MQGTIWSYVALTSTPPPANDNKYIQRGPPDSPYAGGEYHGLIMFPPQYPFKPPGIKVFSNQHLWHSQTTDKWFNRCSLHQDDFLLIRRSVSLWVISIQGLWVTPTSITKPGCWAHWTFYMDSGTLHGVWLPCKLRFQRRPTKLLTVCVTSLTGLLSFMLSDEMTTGSITTAQQEKIVLAARSHAWNISQKRFRDAFPDVSRWPYYTANLWYGLLIYILVLGACDEGFAQYGGKRAREGG